jgi:ribosomal protein S15P/S13E
MAASGSITFDDSLWPLLVAKFEGEPTLQQQEEYFSRLLAYLRRDEKSVGILETSQVRMMTAEHRRRLAEFLKEHDALMRRQLLGCAAVITSPVMQLASSVILYFKPPGFPLITTTTLPEAARWTARRLEDSGLLHPAERIRRHYGLHEQQRQRLR